jgi:surface carbohydrate biosynthesis protein
MNLYIYIEILEREFSSKLLIAMESASRGINVHMGRLESYIKRDFFAPGIILLKSITPSPKRINDLIEYKKKNFIVTSLDEEVGLVNSNDKKYLKLRYSNKSIGLTDKIFTWGKFDYDNLVRKFKKHKSKFVLTGNPRIDFWRKDFQFFYKKKSFIYKDYILFSFNFSLPSKKEISERYKYLKETNYNKRGFTINFYRRRINDCFKMVKEYSKLIKALSKETNSTIIIRPHPMDKVKNYDFFNKFKNVKVINKGNISEWIHHAKIVIHSSCTGGLEASVRERPTISFLPFKSSHGHPFCDKFSLKTKNVKQCLEAIKKIRNNKIKLRKTDLKNIKFRSYNFASNKPGYKIIVDEFIKLMTLKENKDNNNELFLKLVFKIREFRTKVLNYNYGNRKFSTFDKKETLEIFQILKELNPRFDDLSIDFLKKDIIYIKKNS